MILEPSVMLLVKYFYKNNCFFFFNIFMRNNYFEKFFQNISRKIPIYRNRFIKAFKNAQKVV